MPTSYPLDITGLSPGNLIPAEIHTLTEINAAPYRILIPVFAPFYLDNFILTHEDSIGTITPLIPDVDYYHCLPYVGASRSIGKMVYGGVSINNGLIEGTLRITYQTIGGDWVADAGYVRERLIEYIYNPRTTIWDIVTNKPNQFPPTDHQQASNTIFGQQDLIAAIDRVVDQIANQSQAAPSNNSMSAALHPAIRDNPHVVTKEQIGLGLVENLEVASSAEVAARTSVGKYALLSQVLEITQSATFTKADIGLGNVDNTSDLNKPVSSAQQTVLDTKTAFGHGHSKAQVGLGNVDNSSDIDKPVSTAQSAAINAAQAAAQAASTPIAHSGAGNGAHALVTVVAAGFMSAADKVKLDGISTTGGAGGSAVSADRLTTARSIAVTGDAGWSVNFDGSANVTAPLTLTATGVTAGTYPKVTVDSKGRVSGGSVLAATDIPVLDASKITTGTLTLNTTGNDATATLAVSATKLATPRSINGVSFDGTSDIIIGANEIVSIISVDTLAVANGYYVIKAPLFLDLPLNPQIGFRVTAIQFQTVGSTIRRNGSLIMGAADDLNLDPYGSGVSLKFVGDTIGWLISS